MRILISSGGTKVNIDPVRHIANNSSGLLGSNLAIAALKAKAQVTYLCAKQAISPFSYQRNFYEEQDFEAGHTKLNQLEDFLKDYRANYQELRFQDFQDYAVKIQSIILQEKPDIVILAAAVSDYLLANPSEGKIRSAEDLNLQLIKAPKIIHAIKKWLPDTFLVGFKLEVGASDEKLVEVALKSMQQNQLDLVVANDLVSIEARQHRLIVVEKNGDFQIFSEDLAPKLIARVLQRWQS